MFKKERITVVVFVFLTLGLICTSWFLPNQATATDADVTITETWADTGVTVYFTATPSRAGLVEFMVGNNEATDAFIAFGSNSPTYIDPVNGSTTYAWGGVVVTKGDAEKWYDSKGYVVWEATSDSRFNDYTKAFLFTSNPQYVTASPVWTPLSVGTTYYGFYGNTSMDASPFAAHFLEGTALVPGYGETFSEVPEPAILLYLVLSLAGLGRIATRTF